MSGSEHSLRGVRSYSPPTSERTSTPLISLGPVTVFINETEEAQRRVVEIIRWGALTDSIISDLEGGPTRRGIPVWAVGVGIAVAAIGIGTGSSPPPPVQTLQITEGRHLQYYSSVGEARESLRREREMARIRIDANDSTLVPQIPEVSDDRITNLQMQCDMARSLVLGWVSAILSTAPARALSQRPPLFLVSPPGYFQMTSIARSLEQPRPGEEIYAEVIPGTNIVALDPTNPSIQVGSPFTIHLYIHETLHYVAYLASGGDIGIRGRRGGLIIFDSEDTSEFREGATEYLARYISSMNGVEAPADGYYQGVSVMAYLRYLLDYTPPGQTRGEDEPSGLDLLIRAYSSGNYAEVQRRVDGLLGEGTFQQIISATSVRALVILNEGMREIGVTPRTVRDQIGDSALRVLWARVDSARE